MASNPFYLYHGTLYMVPTSEKEHGHFHVDLATIPSAGIGSTSRALHPKGGHNYYAGRDMEKLQRRLKGIAKDVAKAACLSVDIEQPFKHDSEPGTSEQKEMRSSGTLRRRRHSAGGPSQIPCSDLKLSSSRKLARTTSEEGHLHGNVRQRVMGGLVASFSAGVFSGLTRRKAGTVNADNNSIVDAELGQEDAYPSTTSPAALFTEEFHPVPSRGPRDMDPPWVALYMAREQAEDQSWEEKLMRSVWGTLRGVVSFGVAGKAKDIDIMTPQFGDGMTGRAQTA
jgi:hypothetical protein